MLEVNAEELNSYLDNFLQVSDYVDVCPNGCQVQGKRVFLSLATAVTADLATIKKACELKVDALIVHHGLFWNRDVEGGFRLEGPLYEKVKMLLQNGLALFAYHLPLDAHQTVGNNWRAAIELGWNALEPFGHFGKKIIGVKGQFSPRPIKEFITSLEKYYGNSAKCALGGKESVSSAALISGGAYREIGQAIKEKVDCFITGNFDEPVWGRAFEENIHFLAFGHTATEKIGPKALAEHLTKQLGVSCQFIDTNNPF